jgi:hypothetical protein
MAYILIIVVTLILLHFSAPLLLGLFGDHCKLALKLMKMELEKIGTQLTNPDLLTGERGIYKQAPLVQRVIDNRNSSSET